MCISGGSLAGRGWCGVCVGWESRVEESVLCVCRVGVWEGGAGVLRVSGGV